MGFRLTARPKPAAAHPKRPAPSGNTVELSDAELQHVVGGLARTWVDESGRPIEPDLLLPDRHGR